MKKAAIILAGGKGLRMGSDIPKQFIEIAGKPILFYTLESFIHFDKELKITLVLPESQLNYWEKISGNWPYKNLINIVTGGKERFFSVKNGLDSLDECDLIAIHDGVRPLLSTKLLKRAFEFSDTDQAKIPVLPLTDSLRQLTNLGSEAVDRSLFVAVQTPQVFRFSTIKEAYKQDYLSTFTDDASVVEHNQIKVDTFLGDRKNIKITTPEDLKIMKAYLS